jgi:hypothetical protein
MILKRILLVLSLLLSGKGLTQTLPDDRAEFLKTYLELMDDGVSGKEWKSTFKDNEAFFASSSFLAIEDSLKETTKAFMRKKMRANHYQSLMKSALAISTWKGELKPYLDYLELTKRTAQKVSPTSLQELLNFGEGFFSSSALYKSSGHIWKADGDYRFFWDDGKPKLECSRCLLTVTASFDSSLVEATTLVYEPLDQAITLKGGRVYFTRNEIPADLAYITLSNAKINAKRNSFSADSVWMVQKEFFDQPLLGKMEEKLTATGENRDSRYPKFDSYEARFELQDVVPGVDYQGGFSYYGNRFIAKSINDDYSKLTFKREDKPFMIFRSKTFSISKEKISGNQSSVTMILEEDSIFHPGIQFKYLTENKEVSLLRIGDGTARTPFFNSYHKLDMYFEALYWKTNEDYLRIAMAKGSADSRALFKSASYFSTAESDAIRGLAETHPVIPIFNLLKSLEFPASFKAADLAKFMRMNIDQVENMLIQMSISGIVSYQTETQTVYINERFFNFYFARTGQKDFDVLAFESIIKKDNARLSLLDFRLDLFGVSRFAVSDSQSVFIYPAEQHVQVRKNRDLSFSGTIEAGKFGIYGKTFEFNYDRFKIDLNNVDSVKIAVQSFEAAAAGTNDLRFVKTVIERLKGELLIDDPGNKSGSKGLPEYPRLISHSDSYTYYDRPEIEKGVYNRNNVFFKIAPFTLDSLDNFRTEQIQLKGDFYSGIFPVLDEKLSIQPDYSLGFQRFLKPEGLPAYGGKGQFYDTLQLSHRGIRGAGKLKYLTSNIWSHDFAFYPDSTNTMAYKFGIDKSKGPIETPDVKALDVYVHWEPNNDLLEVSNSDKPLEMYEGESAMSGQLTLTPKGLTGDGKMDFGTAEMESSIFNYKSNDFKTDTTSFALKDKAAESGDTANVGLKTDNVRADVTFEGRKGILKSNSAESHVEFPINKFKAYMEELEWFMDRNEVDMNSSKVDDLGLKGALFVSTAPGMDSLAFAAPIAKFVMKTKTIFCEGVEYIDVADARIKPGDKKVTIQKGAELDPLTNATIWVGKEMQTHVLTKADVRIFTSHDYTGTADYTYVDELGSGQLIHFASVRSQNNITYASGKVEQVTNFTMSPYFAFKGGVKLEGNDPLLTFTGYTKIVHPCSNLINEWLNFEAKIDPKDIMIPIGDNPKNDDDLPLYNGFLFASDSTGLYPAIFTKKKRFTDYEVMKVAGFLKYDRKNKEFRVGSKEKLADRTRSGPYLSFNTQNCTSYGEGRMDLGSKMGQVELKAAGNILYFPDSDSTELNLTLSIHFPFPNDLKKIMKTSFDNLPGSNLSLKDEETVKYLTDMLDSTTSDKAFAGIKDDGKFKKLPKEFDRTLVFNQVKLSWWKRDKALQFNGESGLVVFDGEQILKPLSIMMELNRKPSGDLFSLLLIPEENKEFYFQYKSGTLQAYSSIKEFQQTLMGLDAKDRQFTEKKGGTLTVVPSSKRRSDRFKSRFVPVDGIQPDSPNDVDIPDPSNPTPPNE